MENKLSFFKRCIFIEIFVIISSIIATYIFMPIYTAKSIIIPYAVHPFDICIKHPEWWKNIKIAFILAYVLSNIIISNTIYVVIVKIKNKTQKTEENDTKRNNRKKHYKTKQKMQIKIQRKTSNNTTK